MGLRVFLFGENGFNNCTLATSLSMYGFDVLAEIEDDSIAIELITHQMPDVVLLSIDYGHIKSIALAKIIRKRFPDMGIVLITKSEDLRYLGISKNLIPLGVVTAQIQKHSDLEALRDKIKLAPYSTKSRIDFGQHPILTEVQIETLLLMAAGLSNSEIAKLRFVSEKSIEQMLARVAQMLGISFDFQHNTRIRILNSYYELVNGSK
jgi:DNA-binding NarL/FixJ family response regulator